MELNGKIILINPVVSGESKNGIWKKQDFVIETDSQYPKKVCFTLWGDKINKLEAVVGDKVNVSFDVESKESNGRWFTEARAWMIKKETTTKSSEPELPPFYGELPMVEDGTDGLPF
jgi:hypothetical protein